jgi:hypothetical protein
VKKLALALVAVSALGLAACQNNAGNNTATPSDAMNQANSDLENASAAAANMVDQSQNMAEQAGQQIQNATDAAQAAVANAGDAADNAASNEAK